RRPHLVRLSLPADGLDRSVLCRRATDRRRPPRADAERRRQGYDEARTLRRTPAEAFDLADDRLVDRRRLGALLQRRADTGEAARHLPGTCHRLYLDR